MKLREFMNILKSIQDSNNDAIIAISGDRGVGKSTLMMQMARAFKNCRPGQIYDTEKYHIYSQDELIDKMEAFDAKDMLCSDESITALFKRDFGKKNQINLIKMFNTYRDKYYLFFLLVPNFADLDFAVRNSLIIKFWIFCEKRGRAAVFCPLRNPILKDAWNMKQIMAFYERGKLHQVKNFVCYLRWKDLSPKLYRKYQAIKAKKRASAHGVIYKGERKKAVNTDYTEA